KHVTRPSGYAGHAEGIVRALLPRPDVGVDAAAILRGGDRPLRRLPAQIEDAGPAVPHRRCGLVEVRAVDVLVAFEPAEVEHRAVGEDGGGLAHRLADGPAAVLLAAGRRRAPFLEGRTPPPDDVWAGAGAGGRVGDGGRSAVGQQAEGGEQAEPHRPHCRPGRLPAAYRPPTRPPRPALPWP